MPFKNILCVQSISIIVEIYTFLISLIRVRHKILNYRIKIFGKVVFDNLIFNIRYGIHEQNFSTSPKKTLKTKHKQPKYICILVVTI